MNPPAELAAIRALDEKRTKKPWIKGGDPVYHRTYITWHAIKQRCLNPKCAQYKNYGGRGIRMCPEWLDSFDAFVRDMGTAPQGRSIDRIDNDGNYEPGNCCWSTPAQQRANQRTCHYITVKGERILLRHAAIKYGIAEKTLHKRLRRMSPDDAVTVPVNLNLSRSTIRSRTAHP